MWFEKFVFFDNLIRERWGDAKNPTLARMT
jgi:hypothetical protein